MQQVPHELQHFQRKVMPHAVVEMEGVFDKESERGKSQGHR